MGERESEIEEKRENVGKRESDRKRDGERSGEREIERDNEKEREIFIILFSKNSLKFIENLENKMLIKSISLNQYS